MNHTRVGPLAAPMRQPQQLVLTSAHCPFSGRVLAFNISPATDQPEDVLARLLHKLDLRPETRVKKMQFLSNIERDTFLVAEFREDFIDYREQWPLDRSKLDLRPETRVNIDQFPLGIWSSR